jgi:glucose uptake protein
LVWAVGTLSNLVAGSVVDLALSYALGQAAPLIAMGWGVLYYREFAGAGSSAYGALAVMVVLYGCAIALIASSK